MFPSFNIYSTTLLLLTLQGLIFSMLLFLKYVKTKNISNLLLGFILLITCYHQTSYTIGFMDWYDTYRNTKINYYLINLSTVLAPLLFFYIKSVTRPQKRFEKSAIFHFVPALILVIIKVYILIYDTQQTGFDETQNGYLVVNFQWKYIDPFVALFSMFQMLIYLILSFQILNNYRNKIKDFFSNTFKLELNWLYNFLIAYTFLYIYYSIQIVVNETIVDLSWKQEWWFFLLSGLVIIYVGVKGYFTEISKLMSIDVTSFLNQTKNKKIDVLGVDKKGEIDQDLIERKRILKEYIVKHKPFLEPNLTLIHLANKLNISREELSETINKGLHIKFNDFINQHRIEVFKEKIAEGKQQQLSLLGIAYECGFNSKATFNRAFKKHTNQSPSDFLKSIK